MNLSEYTQKRMTEVQTVTIEGVVLKSSLDNIIVFIPCFCVQDTENNPCPCMETVKWLIHQDDLVGEIMPLHKKTVDGELLSRIIINRDARLLIEHSTSVKAEVAVKGAQSSSGLDLFRPPPTWPPFPCPDSNDPDAVYFFWRELIKYVAPALIGAGGAIIGGWLSDDDDCKTTTEETVRDNPDGSTTTTTVTTKKCS